MSRCRTAVCDDTGVVDGHLCFYCQLGVYPHMSRKAGESCGCLPDLFVDLCVQGEVVGSGGAEIRKLVEGVEFVVVDGDDWQYPCVMYQDVRLLHAAGQLEVLACRREAIHQRLEFMGGGGDHNCRVISKKHVSGEDFTYFCCGSEAGDIEQHAI